MKGILTWGGKKSGRSVRLHPPVSLDLLDGQAAGGILDEHFPNERLAVGGHEIGDSVSRRKDAVSQCGKSGCVKGEGATHQHVQHDPKALYIFGHVREYLVMRL